MPWLAQRSIKTKQARKNGWGEKLLGGNWPTHFGLSAAIAACGEPASIYMRTLGGIGASLPSRGSVWVIEPWRSQYSLEVWQCTSKGSVSGRFITPSFLPVNGSGIAAKLKG